MRNRPQIHLRRYRSGKKRIINPTIRKRMKHAYISPRVFVDQIGNQVNEKKRLTIRDMKDKVDNVDSLIEQNKKYMENKIYSIEQTKDSKEKIDELKKQAEISNKKLEDFKKHITEIKDITEEISKKGNPKSNWYMTHTGNYNSPIDYHKDMASKASKSLPDQDIEHKAVVILDDLGIGVKTVKKLNNISDRINQIPENPTNEDLQRLKGIEL